MKMDENKISKVNRETYYTEVMTMGKGMASQIRYTPWANVEGVDISITNHNGNETNISLMWSELEAIMALYHYEKMCVEEENE